VSGAPELVRLLTARQVAERFGVSVQTIRRWTNAGRLRSVGPPRRRRYRLADVVAALAEAADD
jgi:excisionase family DNA binding protein